MKLLIVLGLVAAVLPAQYQGKYETVESIDSRLAQIDERRAVMEREDVITREATRKANDCVSWKVCQKQLAALDAKGYPDNYPEEHQLGIEAVALSLMKIRLRAAPACSALFLSTIDKKASDLTVREAESIKRCRDLDLYK